jgi:Icc-related predicted phosphoesterase
MRLVADVHGAAAALRAVAQGPGPLLVLGDLINFIDYRTYDGIAADLFGKEYVTRMVELRGAGDLAGARRLWDERRAGREDQIRADYVRLIEDAYREIGAALEGARGYVIWGNVDRPDLLAGHLPAGMELVDAAAIEVSGLRVGLVSGGLASSLGASGEISDAEMEAKLGSLGPVDVLCTHVAPDVDALASDVVGGTRKGSPAVLRYLLRHRPTHHYFGDVHQPRAVRWRIGTTLSRNVGYFRATGRVVTHP